ncbi:MAG: DUF1837 domain-containing protein [Candidatus Bathyarchaeota archaeon]|nr:DUF1837 domain-containing protein [Candidatus Bathyarchaeota archaeon]
MIKYEFDKNREEQFVRFLLNNMETYALTDEERQELKYHLEIVKAAFSRFVKNSKTGEFGEMILFFILELYEDAMQIVNKMAIKTSGKIHYHGADSVHFGLNGEVQILYLGESKTSEKDFVTALTDAIKSITTFYAEEKDKFEVELISGNLSKGMPSEIKEAIKKYLDPEQSDKSHCCQTHAVFLGFEESYLLEMEKLYSGGELIKKVTDKYKERIVDYITAIEQKVSKSDVSDKRFYFFILPFKDLGKSRSQFSSEINHVN